MKLLFAKKHVHSFTNARYGFNILFFKSSSKQRQFPVYPVRVLVSGFREIDKDREFHAKATRKLFQRRQTWNS